mmetsp:Transcript_76079/g.219708  ORF Transcript_76079/g.219708 Transcript_76079/m.219708 type:complete len:312 (+) Transcript_76079:1678-2613(+)
MVRWYSSSEVRPEIVPCVEAPSTQYNRSSGKAAMRSSWKCLHVYPGFRMFSAACRARTQSVEEDARRCRRAPTEPFAASFDRTSGVGGGTRRSSPCSAGMGLEMVRTWTMSSSSFASVLGVAATSAAPPPSCDGRLLPISSCTRHVHMVTMASSACGPLTACCLEKLKSVPEGRPMKWQRPPALVSRMCTLTSLTMYDVSKPGYDFEYVTSSVTLCEELSMMRLEAWNEGVKPRRVCSATCTASVQSWSTGMIMEMGASSTASSKRPLCILHFMTSTWSTLRMFACNQTLITQTVRTSCLFRTSSEAIMRR